MGPETPTRFGDTVRQQPGANSTYVQKLLRHLASYNWPGAPRFQGLDSEGREVFDWLPGHLASAPWQPPTVWSVASLERVARLVRQLHDLTVGTALAGSADVVCHNDLSPRTTVYSDTAAGWLPYAFIGWDLAGPGRRVDDVAQVCWQFVGLGPGRSDPVGPGRLMGLICDAYELSRGDRAVLVETILSRQDGCGRALEAGARAGDPAMAALVRDGVLGQVRLAFAWVEQHADILSALVAVPGAPPR